MTDKEKAIVMAHTGICMLAGDKFQIFHKYVEDIMGRPIWTHEIGIESVADEIKAKSKDDFIALCADDSISKNPNRWIPTSERQPKENGNYLAFYHTSDGTTSLKFMMVDHCNAGGGWLHEENGRKAYKKVKAWMPLPQPYKESEE